MNIQYLLCLLAFAAIMVFTCRRIVRVGLQGKEEKRDLRVCFGLGILCFILLFRSCLFDNMKLSYTNINYIMAPFSAVGVRTAGPLLSDVADAQLPKLWGVFVKREFSLWDVDVAFGDPSGSLERLMYPLNWLYLLGLEYGQLLKTVAEYSIAFLGVFFFLRKRNLSIVSSFVGSISYCFSSVMVMWNGWEHSDVCAFGPWLFYYADCLIEHYHKHHEYRLRYCIFFVACLYLMLVAGMPTYVPFFLYTGFGYLLYRLVQSFHQKEERKGGAYLLIALILCIVISGLMSFAYTGNLFFGTQDYQESRASQSFATLSIEYLRTLFFPYDRTSLGMHINESTLYIGPMVLFWLPGMVASGSGEQKKRGEYRFWLIVAITSILLIFVHNAGFLYRYLPALNSSLKIRVIALFCFSASIVSAYCFEFCGSVEAVGIKIRASCLCLVLPLVLLLVFGKLEENLKYYLVFFAVAILLTLFTMYQKRFLGYAVCLLLACNMAVFAQNYMPLIDKAANVIPEPTESIRYLQNNLDGNERVVSLGGWNLFPQSSNYYGIKQVAAHSFINTEKEMSAYIAAIDSSAHSYGPTRTEFRKIDNTNLLSYASVKYMLSGSDQKKNSFQMIENMISEVNGSRRAWAYRGDLVLEQHLVASDSEMNGVDLLLSTYTHDLSKNDVLELALIRTSNGEIASTASIRLDTVLDNKIYSVKWNEPVYCAEGEEFILRLSSAHEFDLPLALWVTDQSIYDGELIINDQPSTGDISLIPTYSDGRMTFSDGETVEELSEYAPRAYFADSILRFASLDAVLEEMKSCFYPETALLDEATWSELSLQLNEDTYAPAAVENYSIGNDRIRMDVTTGTGGILIVTDYYDPDWKVYVNGQESQVFRTNYLFMGVELPTAGDYHVEFKYRPTGLYKCIAVSMFGFMLFVVLIVFRKRIEKAINKSSERKHT
jgi:hypothetical protein